MSSAVAERPGARAPSGIEAKITLSSQDIQIGLQDARESARASLLPFTAYTHHDYRLNWHHYVLAHYLEEFVAGRIKRLIICAPPRTGKSELVSRRLPAYIFGKRPDSGVISASYSATLAKKMSRAVQRIIVSPEYKELFPGTRINETAVPAEGDAKRSAEEFEIVGRRGEYYCCGVGGSITGIGGDYLIVDDPVKSREEANSPVIREKVWDWYRDDLKTRLNGDGGILVMGTRWHVDDLIGRLLTEMRDNADADQWVVLSFPARLDSLADKHPRDPRKAGDVLWPWFFSGKRDDLSLADQVTLSIERLRKWESTNPMGFSSLFQQSPTLRDGGMFDPKHFVKVPGLPTGARSVGCVRYWDKAGTEGGGDFTAGVKMHKLADGRFYIEDIVHGQWSAMNRERRIKETAERDGPGVHIFVEQEPGSGGKESAEATIRMLASFVVAADRPTGDKETRAEPYAAQVEGGNVLVKIAPWNAVYLEECQAFPNGSHVDMVDASSGSFNKLARVGNYGALSKM